jgi:hypothetical protein
MYVYCQKIKTLYVRALETGRKANIYRVFFVFRSEEKQLYFNRQCTYLVFLLQGQIVQNNYQIEKKLFGDPF